MRLRPGTTINPNVPYLHSGSDLYAARGVPVTDADYAIPAVLAVDRNAELKTGAYNAALAAHPGTTRLSYTVPAGHHGLLLHVMCHIIGVPATSVAQSLWQLNTIVQGYYYAVPGIAQSPIPLIVPGPLELPSGTVLDLRTYNGSATSLTFILAYALLEFDA